MQKFSKKWQIIFYESSRGEKFVSTFIDKLDETTAAKVFRTLELLMQYGPLLTMPYCKRMSPKLYELRIGGKIEIRIFYTFYEDKIYLLHSFQKKSWKTPKKELQTAKDRLSTL